MGFFNVLARVLGIGRYTTYVVKKGDTLSGIALKTMGSASKYHAIFEANRPILKDPDKIYPGQVLRIPRR